MSANSPAATMPPHHTSAAALSAAMDAVGDVVAQAAKNDMPLRLLGGGGRQFYGNPAIGEPLALSSLSGIIAYEPSELYLSAGAATPLAAAEALLAENQQMFAFEPPHFSATATIGGTVACGLSGPRRVAAGALRDHMLGADIIDGRGQKMSFGGTVLKNVAGFDISRLMAGALGVLGVLGKVVFRVCPRPEHEITAAVQCDANTAIQEDNRLLAAGLPLTASAWHGGILWRRFSGGEESLRRALQESGGDLLPEAEHQKIWPQVREQEHAFFNRRDDFNIWRLVMPATAAASDDDHFIEWHGAVRWRQLSADDSQTAQVRAEAAAIGGAATLFRAAEAASGGRFPPLSPPLLKIQQNLKRAFDPHNILNRGRLYDSF